MGFEGLGLLGVAELGSFGAQGVSEAALLSLFSGGSGEEWCLNNRRY